MRQTEEDDVISRVTVDLEGVYRPECTDHDRVWYGATSRDKALAETNRRIHNTHAHRDSP